MKFRTYRNNLVHQRLEKEALSWATIEGHTFESPPRPDLGYYLKPVGLGLILVFLLLVTFFTSNTGPGLIAVVIPILAGFTFFKMVDILGRISGTELSHLLPLSHETLRKEILDNYQYPLLKGAFLSALFGFFGANPELSSFGALQGALVYFATLTSLTICFFWKFAAILAVSLVTYLALAFAGTFHDSFSHFASFFLVNSPWYLAYSDGRVLTFFTLFGLGSALFSRRAWLDTSVFDRTAFYENRPGESLDETDPTDGVSLESSPPPLPSNPHGLLEKLTWKFLNIKERGLLRAVGFNQSSFLKSWLIFTSLPFVAVWVSQLNLPAPYHKITGLSEIAGIMILLWSISLTATRTTRYLNGILISPHTIGAQFQALPLTLPRLEKLMWKECIPRWILVAFSFALFPLALVKLENSLSDFANYFLLTLSIIIPFQWLAFWNASINMWVSKRERRRFRHLAIELLIILGMLIAFFKIFVSSAYFTSPEKSPSFSSVAAYSAAIAIHLALIRICVYRYLRNRRTDLIGQD